MTTFAQRRLRNIALAGMGVGLIIAIELLYDMSLRDSAFMNGWLLFVVMVLLMLFNLRKKLNIAPLLPVAIWLQLHIYMGLLGLLLFMLHTEFSWPNGVFEITLWVLYMVVTLSGLTGLLFSRVMPHRISARGERVLFERIPTLRARIAEQVKELAMTSVRETRVSTIADFYVAELARYLYRPRNLLAHLMGANRTERRLQIAINELDRYLDDRGRQILKEISELVQAKADLDYQYAVQLAMKGWLFFHLPISYAVMIFSVAHTVLAYAFSGGSP